LCFGTNPAHCKDNITLYRLTYLLWLCRNGARSFDAIPTHFKLHVLRVINILFQTQNLRTFWGYFFNDMTVSEENKMNLSPRDKNTKRCICLYYCNNYLCKIFVKYFFKKLDLTSHFGKLIKKQLERERITFDCSPVTRISLRKSWNYHLKTADKKKKRRTIKIK